MRIRRFAVGEGEQQLDAAAAHLADVLADGGQGGRKYPDSGVSSNPTTLTSSGTLRPARATHGSPRAPSGRWRRRRR